MCVVFKNKNKKFTHIENKLPTKLSWCAIFETSISVCLMHTNKKFMWTNSFIPTNGIQRIYEIKSTPSHLVYSPNQNLGNYEGWRRDALPSSLYDFISVSDWRRRRHLLCPIIWGIYDWWRPTPLTWMQQQQRHLPKWTRRDLGRVL